MGELLINSIQKLDKSNVSTYVQNLVMDYLLEGKLKPGDKLPTENEFAMQLGVGRNSIREAMKMLSSLGIIEVKRGMGTYIAETISESVFNPLIIQLAFSQKTPHELIELRIFFDTAIAELALEKMQDSDIAVLEAINENMYSEMQKSSPSEGVLGKLDLEFHSELIRLTRNNLIIKIGEAIYTLFFSSINDSIRYAGRLEKGHGYHNHIKVIDALKHRNQEEVRKAVKESLEHWRKQLEQKK